MNEVDTREKLYADVDHWLGSWTAFSVPTRTIKEAVLGWLDRAADIREREFVQYYCSECETAENAALKGDIATLRDRLDKLQAENDALLAAHADDVERLDSMGEGELLDQIGVMTEEISEILKKQPYTFDVNDVQGSIRLVGRYIDELADELAKRDKGIERLKARRDELQARVNELEAELTAAFIALGWSAKKLSCVLDDWKEGGDD